MTRYLQILLLLSLSWCTPTSKSYAQPYRPYGGDAWYQCLGFNMFEITYYFYRIDNTYPSWEGYSVAFNMDNDSIINSSLIFNPTKEEFFNLDEHSENCYVNAPKNKLVKVTYVSNIIYLPPNQTGYRIPLPTETPIGSIKNIEILNRPMLPYLYLDIPPFSNNECINNSPIFNNHPLLVHCKNYPLKYSYAATDPDNDSLSYRLCSPLFYIYGITHVEEATFISPYSVDYPVASNPAITIDPVTGMICGTPTEEGRYMLNVCVDEWRNNTIINTSTRSFVLTVANCTPSVIAALTNFSNDICSAFAIHCFKDRNVTFKNLSTPGLSYLWHFGVGNATSTLFEPEFTYPQYGSYEVTLIVSSENCVDSIRQTVIIKPEFKAAFDTDGLLCPNSPISFTPNITIENPEDSALYYHWNFDGSIINEQKPSFTFNTGGAKTIYLATENAQGCKDTVVKTLFLDTIKAFAGLDTLIVKDYEYQFEADSAKTYLWMPNNYLSNPNIRNPIAIFPNEGNYQYILTTLSESECSTSDTIDIKVIDAPISFLPNAFTPNGDGLNDVLRPHIVGFRVIQSFEIYNRYGTLVFKSTNNNQPAWDGTFQGKPAPTGVYFYKIVYINAQTGNEMQHKGDVTLLR